MDLNKWAFMYNLAREYFIKNGNLKVPHSYKVVCEGEIYSLGNWIDTQRQNNRKGVLNKEQVMLLEAINMYWGKRTLSWEEYYKEAKKFYEENGHLFLPGKYMIKRGDQEYDLNSWISRIRYLRNSNYNCNITEEQIALLDKIGMVWNDTTELRRETDWNTMYKIAEDYYNNNHNLLVPFNYSVVRNGKKYNLGTWMVTQRQAYLGHNNKSLSEEHIKSLEKIGMVWDTRKDTWLVMYDLAKEYYEKNGNLLVPFFAEVYKNGIRYRLGAWIQTQRNSRKGTGTGAISEEQIRMLDKIGMNWGKGIARWDEMYNFAKEYYLKNGNLLVSRDFLVNVNGKEKSLKRWIINQRVKFKKGLLPKEKVDLLNEIGMIWSEKLYNIIDNEITNQYNLYLIGLLDQRNVEEFLQEGIFKYRDDELTIVKGSALTISNKKLLKNMNKDLRKTSELDF